MNSILRPSLGLSANKRALLGALLKQEGVSAGSHAIGRAARDGALPLSFAQQRLWFLDQLAPGSPAYNLPGAMRLSGPLQPTALQHALAFVVQRHEALRTAFAALDDGRPVQLVAPHLHVPLPLDNLADLPPAHRAAELDRLALAHAELPFDLAHGPLIRARLLRLAPDQHVLLLVLHHIVADGWSLDVLVRELATAYAALVQDLAPSLPDLPIQYPDFAVWQRDPLHAPALDQQLDYWRQRLAQLPILELPTDRPRPPLQSFRGAALSTTLSAQLSHDLRALAERQGVTLFMLLLAAFQILLARYSGQTDLAVGSPIASRSRRELEGLIGFFVNTLVLRTDLSANPSFHELLARVKETCLGAYSHQDLPFEKLVEALHPDRDPSQNPLVQVAFSLERDSYATFQLGEIRGELMDVYDRTAKFDLFLECSERPEGVRAMVQYSADLFEAETIERLLGHFHSVLQAVVAQPNARLADLPLLSDSEQHQLLDWTATTQPYPELGVHQLFEHHAALTPEATALVWGDDHQHLSYAQLNAQANQLAHHLLTLGVTPEARVGVCLERSPQAIVALLAILKAGAAYVPLDPGYPPDRLAFMLADANISLLLSRRDLAHHLPLPTASSSAAFASSAGAAESQATALSTSSASASLDDAAHSSASALDDASQAAAVANPALICLDAPDAQAALACQPLTNPALATPPSPDHLAYVIYTSGSTGRPKGAAVTHRGVVRLVCHPNFASLSPDQVFLQFAPLAFDASTLEIWGALANGARLALPPASELLSLAQLGHTLRHFQVTTLWLTAGLFHQMVESQLDDLRGLHQLLAGGDVLSVPHVQRVLRELPNCQLINGYGPTECTTFSTCFPLSPDADADFPSSVPIGRPITNTQVYVLDPRRQLVPIGVPGELFIGGPGLARGYLDQPDLTAERFVPNPFQPGTRLYRSGDLVRWRPDGLLDFLGRLDHQVKIRGFRIEPAEIEAVLTTHPAVRDAAVVPLVDGPVGARLVAYLVPADPDLPPATADLRAFVRERLPEYMLPSAFVSLAALPLSPNGKLDRAALPAPDGTPTTDDTAFVAPRTPVEHALAAIWADVLGLPADHIGIHHNFFELGGHSLLATQLVARVRDQFQVELPLRALFEAPTIAGLAGQLQVCATDVAESAAIQPIGRAARDGALPLSFAQQRLWFLDQLAPGSPAYNLPGAMRLSGPLQPTALQHALGFVVQRHEALRTTFAALDDGRPVQLVAPHLHVPLPLDNLADLPPAHRAAELDRLALAHAELPFDLAHGPLIRARLLRLAPDQHVLLLVLHHIVADGWSLDVLVRELATAYAALVQDLAPSLPDLPIQYPDFAVWQRDPLHAPALDQQLDYWRQRLAQLPILELPTDRPRPPLQSFRGAALSTTLSAQLSHDLRALAERQGVTLFMLLLAAFQILLARYSGQADLAVGSPIASRSRRELEGLIGFFVNTLVLRTDLSANPSFHELLARVKETCLGAYSHQDLPFEKLVEALHPDRDPSQNPLVQVAFGLQRAAQTVELPGLVVEPLPDGGRTAKFDLTLVMEDAPDTLRATLEYSTDLFDAATAERLLGHLQVLLEHLVADPTCRVSDVSLLTDTEQQQLLVDWNATTAAYPRQECLHELVERQAERTPDAVAVVFDSAQLTYAELNVRANQLAHHLRRMGVGLEDRVGVCLDRSLDQVVSFLGILKAGAVYVPLDPAYPSARLAFMLQHARVRVLLTHAALLDSLAPHSTPVLCLDSDCAAVASAPTTSPARLTTPDNLAYLIYTSGSTGRPKGVLIQHGGLVCMAEAQIDEFGLQPGDRVLQFFSLSFDASVFEMVKALRVGATLYLASRDDLLPGPELVARLRDQAITMALLPPAALGVLPAAELPALHTIAVAGEACPADVVARWAPGHRFFNLYGPTEITIWATVARCTPSNERPPIGRPIANTQVYVLDPRRQLVPIGVPGELFIGGPGLARGYLDQPDLTAERFVPNPFQPGTRLYRSGDLVRWRPDGLLDFLGRLDHQVKIRGFRIEPAEIEAVLTTHPAVRDAAVVPLVDGPVGARLVAYLVPTDPDQPPATADLRAFVRERLPEYMLPATFVTLAALPLSPNGKLDRAALPAPDGTPTADDTAYVAPRTPVEHALAAIWADVLGLPAERVGVEHNFFELGGDSILSIQVVVRASRAGLRLTPKQVFQHQTIAALAAVAGTVQAPSAEQAALTGPLPLTPIQHWFFEEDFAESHHWNQAHIVEAHQSLDPAVLERAVAQLVVHHDALRLRFHHADDWQQSYAPPDEIAAFQSVDLSDIASPEQEQVMRALARNAQASLDLASGPVLRAVHFVRGDHGPDRLLIVIHHLAVDAVSWQILLEDLQSTYLALADGEAPTLPPKTSSFRQWAQRLADYAQSPALHDELGYWLSQPWSDARALPVDVAHGSNSESSSRTLSVTLDAEHTRALLQDVPAVYHTQINDVLLTALVQSVATTQHTGSPTLLVNLEGHGREPVFDDVDVSRTVGWFTTAFPVLLSLDRRQLDRPGDALKVIKEQLRRVPGRGIGYGLLRYLSDDPAAAALRDLPRPQVSFNYLGRSQPAHAEAGLFDLRAHDCGPVHSPRAARSHLLDVVAEITNDELNIHWLYSDQVHHAETVERLAQAFVKALRTLITHCRSPQAGGFTPSDFPRARVDQKQLDSLLAKLGRASER